MPKKDDEADNELIIYLLVRTDLKMTKGKVIAQTGHAIQDLLQKCPGPIKQEYLRGDHTKIALKIRSLDEMESFIAACKEKGILYHQVVDAGRTQVAPDTETVLGIGPVKRKLAKGILGNLSLY